MKLPDFLQSDPLNELRKKMNAPLGQFEPVSLPPLTLSLWEQEQLQESGIEIPLEEVRISEDQILTYKEAHVVLYIRTPVSGNLPKFHICDCTKLRQMRANHRMDRYVVSNREDGSFEIEQSGQKKVLPLDVCQYCLGQMKWMGFSYEKISSEGRHKIVKNFSLKEFFKQYGHGSSHGTNQTA
ncbi:MAG: hypothetical protein ACYCT9_08900 [Leptospirillum sp.]|jgi:hypothetical protein